eukprot:CAMPEP_0202370970 /NCGR_PEP_ID=MMETSP1127-20130417/2474_1 /ASSEMBLY_ACC=CAM_ASM_000462 /TAXON_ID=3047 /ORGANISM="Dunaliella tertiolecta, Strain CCMP1320" /LENGTH=738 /DNA_ID=CAMNT_0048967061 /DNA_START=274 /DNA_END=2490 /DNA_ORIENTATION=+
MLRGSSDVPEEGTVSCPGCHMVLPDSEYSSHTLSCADYQEAVESQYPKIPSAFSLYGLTSSYGFGFQGSYYVSESTDTATHHSCSDDGQPEPPLCASTVAEGGWDLTPAPEPGRWTVLQGGGEPRVRLPPSWQQRYMQMGEQLVAPVEVDAQRPRKVAVVGPIGQGKGALINNLMRSHCAEVGKGRGNSTAPDPWFFTADLQLQDVPGYNGLHERDRTWMEWLLRSSNRRPIDKVFKSASEFVRFYHDIFTCTDAVMYVLSHRGMATDAEILQEMIKAGKMVFLVITHCEELRYYGPFEEKEAQAHREEIRRDTFAAMGTVDEGMAAVFERMPTFFVQCPWPKTGFHPSQERVVAEYLSSNCSSFDFPALRAYLESPRGICGQLRLQTTLESILHQQMEEYIMQKTGSLEVFLKALTLFGADVAAPGFLSFGLVASSSVWTMLDMMDLAGMMEGYEVEADAAEAELEAEVDAQEAQEAAAAAAARATASYDGLGAGHAAWVGEGADGADSDSDDGDSVRQEEREAARGPAGDCWGRAGRATAAEASAAAAAVAEASMQDAQGGEDDASDAGSEAHLKGAQAAAAAAAAEHRREEIRVRRRQRVGGGWRERLKAVFSIQAWDLALISSAKQPLQNVMLGVVTQKLQEVFGKHFFERVLQAMVAAVVRDLCMGLVAYSVPFIGAAVYFASVRPFMRRIARSVTAQALPLHRVWIEQNTGVLLPSPKARSVPRAYIESELL